MDTFVFRVVFFKLTRISCGYAMAPIDEAVQIAEMLLALYTIDDHSRCALVVHEPCVNKAYRGQGCIWRSRPNQMRGRGNALVLVRRARLRIPFQHPLRAGRPGTNLGPLAKPGSSSATLEDPRPLKRANCTSTPMHPSSPTHPLLSASPSPPLIPGHGVARDVQVGVENFEIAGLNPEESSAGSTPSHVYASEAKGAREAPPAPRCDTICKFYLLPLLFIFLFLTSLSSFLFVVVFEGDDTRGSEETPPPKRCSQFFGCHGLTAVHLCGCWPPLPDRLQGAGRG